jgi:hypothetical protein
MIAEGTLGKTRPAHLCRCSCGKERLVRDGALTRGESISCGCYQSEVVSAAARKRNTTHGANRTRLHRIWHGMLTRCNDPENEDYGGRGISVCPEWHDFAVFQTWALANGYRDDLQIDRFPNNDGNYEPGNCRFATNKDNNRNRRDNVLLTAWGATKTIAEWAEDSRCLISYDSLVYRVGKGKWDHERAISTPSRQHKKKL